MVTHSQHYLWSSTNAIYDPKLISRGKLYDQKGTSEKALSGVIVRLGKAHS